MLTQPQSILIKLRRQCRLESSAGLSAFLGVGVGADDLIALRTETLPPHLRGESGKRDLGDAEPARESFLGFTGGTQHGGDFVMWQIWTAEVGQVEFYAPRFSRG